MKWYKIAQKKWQDFQWNEPGFRYKQCYNCGIFFLPNDTFAYPPGTTSSNPSMSHVLKNIPTQDKEKYQVNKNTITHGLCPKCFVEQMQRDLGFSYKKAVEMLEDQYPEDLNRIYHN